MRSGVGLGMAFEFLDLHSVDHTPAADQTFFLCFLGYWAQTIVGAAYGFVIYNSTCFLKNKPIC